MEITDITYDSLASTYSEDYPLFEYVVVIRCNSKLLRDLLISEFPNDKKYAEGKAFHFTIFRKYRERYNFFKN